MQNVRDAASDYWKYFSAPGALQNLFGDPAGLSELERGMEQSRGTLSEYGERAAQELSPYEQFGIPAWQQYQTETGRMLDPAQLESQMMQGYSLSPEAQFAQKEGLAATQRGAAARGLGGGALQAALARQSQDIASKDYNSALMRRLGVFGGGVGGLQKLGGLGYGAAKGTADIWGSLGANLAQLQAQQAQAAAQAQQSKESGIMGALGSAAGMAGGLF